MKIAPTTVMADDGGIFDVVSLSLQLASSGSGCSGGNSRSGSSGSDDDGVLSLSLLGASFWSKCWLGGWWSGTSSHTSMAADIGGMAPWRLGVRCTEMDSCRRRLLSGVMVMSMAEWPDKVEASI